MARVVKKREVRSGFRAIADELAGTIYQGELKPGDRLPTEQELSERFGVSRVVIREALRYLEQQGLVFVKRGYGGGNFVAMPNSRPVQETLMAMLRTGQLSMQDLTEARSIYEPKVARLAALRINDQELAKVAEVIQRQETALETGQQEEFNLRFHQLVAEATHNPALVMAMNSIVNILLPEVRSLELDRLTQQSIVDYHRKIYAALKARDPDTAAELMARHIVDVQGRLARLEIASHRGRR
jgi:DNA-binding FadR family transcriptional regulator